MKNITYCFAILIWGLIIYPALIANDAIRLTEDTYADFAPSVSPDGKMVAYISAREGRRVLILLDIKSRKQFVLAEKLDKKSPIAWSADSKTVCYAIRKITRRHLYLVEITTKKSKFLCEGNYPAFSPDGKYLTCVDKKDVLICELKNKNITNLTNSSNRSILESPVWSANSNKIYYCKNGDLWSVEINGKNDKEVLSHFLGDKDPIVPTFSSFCMDAENNLIFMTLVTDGLYAHATDNIFSYYDINKKKLVRISEGNNWCIFPGKMRAFMNCGNILYDVDVKSLTKKEFTKAAYPSLSPDGKNLIYLSRKDMSEEFDLYIINFSK